MLDISQKKFAQISCRNSAGMISFIIENFGYEALNNLFEGILTGQALISTTYQYLGSPLTLDYFKDENNWYSNEINLRIFDNLAAMGIDAFNTGKYAVRTAGQNKNIATIAYLQMLGPEKILKKINYLNSLYNRTKNITFVKSGINSVTLKIQYNCPHSYQVTRQNIGAYVGGMELAGLKNIQWKLEFDDFTEVNQSIITFQWQARTRLEKLRWLLGRKIATCFCKAYLQTDAVIQDFHKNIVSSFENEIAAKEIQRNKSETYYNQLLEQQEKKEQELSYLVEEKTKQLAQSIKDKEELFENFSHELKTPLTLIIGPIEQLLKQSLPVSAIEQLQGVNTNAHRLFDLVTTLLDFAEIKVNRSKKVPINIYLSTCHIISSLEPLAATKNINIKLTYQCDKHLNLQLQAQAWELILSNLISNAIKHGQNGNGVLLRIKQNGQQLQLTVSDNNQPINESDQQKNYARFSRSESRQRGHGLGLAIINELTLSHGGDFSLTTQEGGNKFIITLPLTLRSPEKRPYILPEIQLENEALPARSKPSKVSSEILLVEDNIELAEFLIASFKPYFNVHHALNGQEAMQQLELRLYDLILSDVMMPIMDGFELCRQVKSNQTLQHIPFILLTAKSGIENQKKGLSLKADDYIGKPFNTELLIQKMDNLIQTYQAHSRWVKQQIICADKDSSSEVVGCESKQELQNKLLQQIQTYLQEHYKNSTIKADDIAQCLYMSEKTLNRKLQVMVGTSVTALLREYRLNQAKQQLRQGGAVKEVCFNCGFNSLSYFSRCFKTQFNISPAAYQKANLTD